ncbi:DUF4193 domain-containing protein [Mycolicibacterium sp.]|uniref:DUF4193 domain-containing protein n=1 Tax=Mycolicibacterium sp. TaxID=2320850 RepID=UPI0028A80DFA|nr:DUF4193 domain-containing protein [Mycolicibacterium sp.]
MTVDYDAPRRASVDADEPLDELAVRRNDSTTAVLDIDEADAVASYELPGADLFDEELTVRVVPKQPDEFTCSSCFLVHHRSRLARGNNGDAICTECA